MIDVDKIVELSKVEWSEEDLVDADKMFVSIDIMMARCSKKREFDKVEILSSMHRDLKNLMLGVRMKGMFE